MAENLEVFNSAHTGATIDAAVNAVKQKESKWDAKAETAYVNSLAAHQATVTLTAAGWASKAQTVSVAGILKDQTKQVVDVAPADTASRDAWAKAGIWCTDPTADGKLTFTCDTVPTAAVNVRVRWQGVAV